MTQATCDTCGNLSRVEHVSRLSTREARRRKRHEHEVSGAHGRPPNPVVLVGLRAVRVCHYVRESVREALMPRFTDCHMCGVTYKKPRHLESTNEWIGSARVIVNGRERYICADCARDTSAAWACETRSRILKEVK